MHLERFLKKAFCMEVAFNLICKNDPISENWYILVNNIYIFLISKT